MTNQKTRNQDENRVSRKSPIKFSFCVIITSIIVMAICVSITNAVTCPTPLTGKVAVNTEEATFAGYSYFRLYKIVAGTSNMLYSLIYVTSSARTVIRKTDTSGVESWIVSLPFAPLGKSLAVDSSEQNVFVGTELDPIVVLRISASTRAVNEQNSL